ncbi:hypothetical protein O3M35_003848 [Rhynocoris fuscipes]|uniref:ZZ-type domain-containing protein n=1 Tax=Rhynocoris fuscipes TaxID=488301 RepID=A0AAW1CGM8_9HEMI
MSTVLDVTDVKFKEISDSIESCNSIRYAAYRTAAKLSILQKNLSLDKVGLNLIKNVFEQHRIFSTDLYFTFNNDDFEAILYDIFFAASKMYDKEFDVDISVNLTKNLLISIYQPKNDDWQEESIELMRVFEAKVGIVLLCNASLLAKYRYWFSELSDHNLRLSRKRLSLLLNAFLSFTHYLNEQKTFSHQLLEFTLDSCFNKSNSSLGINESDFLNWVLQEPQMLVWHSTFYRLSTSENVIHHVHCSVCGMHPIVGLRYHCLSCIRYNLCQDCFFTGRTSKRHKTNHIIREYCAKTSTYETTIAYLRGIINRLCGNKRRLQYLPLHRPQDLKKENSPECSGTNMNFNEKFSHLIDSAFPGSRNKNPEYELDKIISQIEHEFRLVQDAVNNGSTANIIQRHADFLKQHLYRLKVLQHDLKRSEKVTSTPKKGSKTIESEIISPLSMLTENNTFDEYGTLKMLVPCTSPSGFSEWIEEAGGLKTDNSETYGQLEKELDIIMDKLNKMLESSFPTPDEIPLKIQ